MFKLSKTTSPQKLFPSDCITVCKIISEIDVLLKSFYMKKKNASKPNYAVPYGTVCALQALVLPGTPFRRTCNIILSKLADFVFTNFEDFFFIKYNC